MHNIFNKHIPFFFFVPRSEQNLNHSAGMQQLLSVWSNPFPPLLFSVLQLHRIPSPSVARAPAYANALQYLLRARARNVLSLLSSWLNCTHLSRWSSNIMTLPPTPAASFLLYPFKYFISLSTIVFPHFIVIIWWWARWAIRILIIVPLPFPAPQSSWINEH